METNMTAGEINPEALREWIGRVTAERPLELVSASDIRRYIDATEDANPLWLDDEFAKSKGHRGRLLPPSLVAWEPFSRWTGTHSSDYRGDDLLKQLPFPQNYTDMRNAGSEIEWLRPVALGEALTIQSRIVDIVVRQGKAGLGIYVTREERILDSDKKPVLLRRQTTVHLPQAAVADRGQDRGK
jgi:acyl dehydratase